METLVEIVYGLALLQLIALIFYALRCQSNFVKLLKLQRGLHPENSLLKKSLPLNSFLFVISQMMAATIIIFMAMIALMIVVDGIQIKALTETLSQPKNLIPAILLIFITLGAFNFLMDLNRKIKEKIKQ